MRWLARVRGELHDNLDRRVLTALLAMGTRDEKGTMQNAPCVVCGSNPTHRYGPAVDEVVLRLHVPLCQAHGDKYLLLAACILSELLAR